MIRTAFRSVLFAVIALCGWNVPLAHAATASSPVVLVVGDSISAGYGLNRGQVWVDQLTARLKEENYSHRVVNASISGDTTAGGRARLPALLAQHKPALVIIELGGNDALRGGRLDSTRANLDAMVAAAQATSAQVLILGVQLPPNYGAGYVRDFGELFGSVARARKVPVVAYLFDGFGNDLAYFQPDRIHPTANAQARLLDNVWPTLKPLLKR